MAKSGRKIERLKKVILRKASDVVLYQLHDPRLGFITLSKVDLSDDLRYATIYYSVMGDDAVKSRTRHALEAARGYIQKAIGSALKTRVAPHVRLQYDESIEGVMRISRLIDETIAGDERVAGGSDGDDDDAPDEEGDERSSPRTPTGEP